MFRYVPPGLSEIERSRFAVLLVMLAPVGCRYGESSIINIDLDRPCCESCYIVALFTTIPAYLYDFGDVESVKPCGVKVRSDS
jgi:hypothetical protein